MKLSFPYETKASRHYGNSPLVSVTLPVDSPQGPVKFQFLFDTGADVTSMPVTVAKKLGINLQKQHSGIMTGYEGQGVLVYRSQITVNFNKKKFSIPCVFTPKNHVPILLGRAGILSRFNILLDGKNKQITFTEI